VPIRVAVFLMCFAALPVAFGAEIVTVTLTERAGSARKDEPVTSGVPLPRGLNICSTNGLRLVDRQGRAVPAQFTPLARWGAAPSKVTAPIKWLLVDFQSGTVPARGSASYLLQDSGSQPAFPVLRVTESSSSVSIDTGKAQFVISKQDGRLRGTGFGSPLTAQVTSRDGKICTATGAISVDVQLQGKMRASVRVRGQYQDASKKRLLDFTSRYWFYAGQSSVRLFHTVENNTPGTIDEYGQISCFDIGSGGSVTLRDVSLIIDTDLSGTATYALGGDREVTGTVVNTITLYQDSSGTANWNLFPTLKDWDGHPLDTAPRMQSYVRFRGYTITSGSAQVNAGRQARGWLVAEAGSRDWAVSVRDFWQNFPKAIRMTAGNEIQVGLFPDEFGPAGHLFCLRAGEHKTHEVLLDPSPGDKTLPRTFSSPLFAAASSNWYLQSGVLGQLSGRNVADWRVYEKYIDYQLTTSPDYQDWFDWFPNIFAAIEGTDHYGIFDYGDVPLDYEGYHVAPMNLKYNMDYGMWVQWMRGGDSRYFGLADAADRHIADIDILHTLHKPRHWSDGIMFGHSYHDEEGFANPHRNYGGASCDLASGLFGMFMTYYLTGYEKAWESAVELADCFQYRISNDILLDRYFPKSNHEGFALMEWVPGFYGNNERPAAHCLNAMVAAYTATADKRYLTAANAIVGWADPTKQPYIDGPTGESGEDDFMSPQFLNYYCKSLGLYQAALQEFKQRDKHNSPKRLVAFMDFMRAHVWVDTTDIGFGPRAGYPYRWYFDDRDENRELEMTSWLMVGADAMTLAYQCGDERNYLDRAAVLFRAGSIDPWYQDDANTYSSTKEMTNAVSFGNVFVDESTRE